MKRRRASRRGGIYKQPGSRFFWIRYRHAGRQIRESSKSTSREDAEVLLARRLSAVDPVAGSETVNALLDGLNDHYEGNRTKYARDYARKIDKHLRPWFGALRCRDVSSGMLHEFIRHCRKSQMANATINRTMALLRKAFKLRGLQFPVWQQLQEDNVRVGFLEPADFVRLKKRLPAYLRPLVQFAYETGARKSECLALEWSQIDLARREVAFRPGTTKNKRGRTVPLTRALAYELKILPRTSELVFTRRGRPIRAFTKAFSTACAAVGLSALRFHDLRRSAVRNMVRVGISERVAMDISGHLTRSVFDRYNVTSGTDLKAAALKLERHLVTWTTKSAVKTTTRPRSSFG